MTEYTEEMAYAEYIARDPHIRNNLLLIGYGCLQLVEDQEKLLEAIPKALDPVAIDILGLGVANLVELQTPSRDGMHNGSIVERRALGWLATASLQRDDVITAQNIGMHLRAKSFSLADKARGSFIGLQVMRYHLSQKPTRVDL